MKNPTRQGLKWMLVLTGASLIFSCSNQTTHLNAQGSPPLYTSPTVLERTPAAPAAAATFPQMSGPQPDAISAPPAVAQPAGPIQVPSTYSPAVAELAKLAQGNVSDSILNSYVDNNKYAFNLTADEILYLTDLGISDAVVSGILAHDRAVKGAAGAAVASNSAPVQYSAPATTSNMTGPVPVYSAPPPVSPATTTVVSVPQDEVSVSYFHDSLTPYGSWVQVEDYGVCWQPSVVVVDPGWRPYSNRGHWLYTDNGWYWQSDYSWGWAAFHYGRWYSSPRHGWVWSPDTTWGPSWVSWRQSSDYCGWAPLPPRACYSPGIGFTYQDRNVGLSFEFGLSHEHYTFVPTGHFHDRNPYRYAVGAREIHNVYNNTTVINNYVQVNNTVINNGVSRERVAAASGRPVQTVRLRDMSAPAAMASPRKEILDRNATSLAVYRPQAPNAALATSGFAGSQNRKPVVPAEQATHVAPVFANRPVFNPSPSTIVGKNPAASSQAPRSQAAASATPTATAANSAAVNHAPQRYSGPAAAPSYDGVVRGTETISANRPFNPRFNNGSTPAVQAQAINPAIVANNNAAANAQRVAANPPRAPQPVANPNVHNDAPTPTPTPAPNRNIFTPQVGNQQIPDPSRPLNRPFEVSRADINAAPRTENIVRPQPSQSVPMVNSRSYNNPAESRSVPTATRPVSPDYQIPSPRYDTLRPQVQAPAYTAPAYTPPARAYQAPPNYQSSTPARPEQQVVIPRAQPAPQPSPQVQQAPVQSSRGDNNNRADDVSNRGRGALGR